MVCNIQPLTADGRSGRGAEDRKRVQAQPGRHAGHEAGSKCALPGHEPDRAKRGHRHRDLHLLRGYRFLVGRFPFLGQAVPARDLFVVGRAIVRNHRKDQIAFCSQHLFQHGELVLCQNRLQRVLHERRHPIAGR